MAKMNIEYGLLTNQIPYARWGRGEKIMLIFSGGPGNTIPARNGISFNKSVGNIALFIAEYFDKLPEDVRNEYY